MYADITDQANRMVKHQRNIEGRHKINNTKIANKEAKWKSKRKQQHQNTKNMPNDNLELMLKVVLWPSGKIHAL